MDDLMSVIEVQIATEDDGLIRSLRNERLNPNHVRDAYLADKLEQLKELIDSVDELKSEIDTYMNEKIEEIREDNEDDCDLC